MINQKQIESLGWFKSALASSKYEPNYFLRDTLDDFPSGVWLTNMHEDVFRIVMMMGEYHQVLFLGKIEKHEDLVNLMRMLNLKRESDAS